MNFEIAESTIQYHLFQLQQKSGPVFTVIRFLRKKLFSVAKQ